MKAVIDSGLHVILEHIVIAGRAGESASSKNPWFGVVGKQDQHVNNGGKHGSILLVFFQGMVINDDNT